jgi:hypothetical protein
MKVKHTTAMSYVMTWIIGRFLVTKYTQNLNILLHSYCLHFHMLSFWVGLKFVEACRSLATLQFLRAAPVPPKQRQKSHPRPLNLHQLCRRGSKRKPTSQKTHKTAIHAVARFWFYVIPAHTILNDLGRICQEQLPHASLDDGRF